MVEGEAGGGLYLSVGGETSGPFPLEDLAERQARGEIAPAALLWDGAAWRPVAEVLGPPPVAAVPVPTPAPARKKTLTPREEGEAIARALAMGARAEGAASVGRSLRAVYVVVATVGACISLYLGSAAIRAAFGAKSMADARQMKTQMMIAFSEEASMGADPPPAAGAPRALPEPLAGAYRRSGIRNPWGHPLEYVSDGRAIRILAPLGKERDLGVLVGDPMTSAVWLWPADSGPLTWTGVAAVPEDAIP